MSVYLLSVAMSNQQMTATLLMLRTYSLTGAIWRE
jgi:hypothetical protein